MIKDFFKNKIDRSIDTVIKADDRSNISSEVFEFVITDEIAKYMGALFDAYNTLGSHVNGVWISGHFGNGKSHLLKILSYVLENKEHDGWYSGEVFAEKIEDDEMLRADVLKSIQTPAESILFNIDQHEQSSPDEERKPLVAIFYKIFYEHLGYYGYVPHIAEFERWLDMSGDYQTFKDTFQELNSRKWEEARYNYYDPTVEDNIASALSRIKGKDAERYRDVLIEIEDRYTQSIENFGHIVNEYIESQPQGFRLNFFVDEVGQYVGDDVQMMLNLQTIAETLATKTHGRSWMMVTSQADIETVVNWEKKQEMDNFGRIQARFKIRIPLSAKSADEVVEKRLLTKKKEAQALLEKLYQKQAAHIGSLLSFSEAGIQFRGYRDEQDFAQKFPMVPYQFGLFKQSRTTLSKHEAFQGAHAAVGSRSMLGVFQQVILAISDQDEYSLVPFDSMYEGIKGELRGTIQGNMEMAEKELTNAMAIRILKTLFMVKYFDKFKTTKRNISVLLIDNQHINLQKHEEEIDKALNILESQSYIQRKGEFYEYLTDIEKDIDVEIRDTLIDEQAITTFLKEIFFDDILKDTHFTYEENKIPYEFSSLMNGVLFGREKELKIELITDDYNNNEQMIMAHSMGTSVLKLLLRPSSTFLKDVRLYKQAEKYQKQKMNTANDAETMGVLRKVGMDNTERKSNILAMAQDCLAQSVGFVNGNRLPPNGTKDGRLRVIKAFQILVTTVYPNLPMLKNINFSEATIRATITGRDDLFKGAVTNISEAEREILTQLTLRKKQHERTSLIDLKNILIGKPYGWYPNAIWTLVAKLYKEGKIELIQNGNTVEKSDLGAILINSSNHVNTLLTLQVTFDPVLINQLKQIYSDAFDESCPVKEAKEIALTFKDKIKQMSIEVNQLLVQKMQFPFLDNLNGLSHLLNDLSSKNYDYFINQNKDFEDQLLDAKMDILDPIRRFMNGHQKNIYQEAQSFLTQNNGNLSFVKFEDLNALKSLMADKKPYLGNKMKEIKQATDHLEQTIISLIETERNKTLSDAQQRLQELQSREEYNQLSEEQQKLVCGPLEYLISQVKNERLIALIQKRHNELEQIQVDALNRIYEFKAEEATHEDNNPSRESKIAAEPVKYVSKSIIPVSFDKDELKTKEDVLAYVEALKAAYLKFIEENKRIRV